MIVATQPFRRFQDARWPHRLRNLLLHFYIYPGKEFEKWLWEQVKRFNKKTWQVRPPALKDLRKRLTIYASQEGVGTVMFDSQADDGNRGSELTFAIRCSMSIPLFFKPPLLNGRPVFDGGLLNNFPAKRWTGDNTGHDFIGIYLGPKVLDPAGSSRLDKQLINTVIDKDDAEFIDTHRERVMVVDPDPVGTSEFDLSREEADFLVLQGRADALEHLYRYPPEHDRPDEEEVSVRRREADAAKVKAVDERRRRKRWKSIRRAVAVTAVVAVLAFGVLKFGAPALKLVTGRHYDWLYDQAEAYQQYNDKESIDRELGIYKKLIAANHNLVSVYDNQGYAYERMARVERCEDNFRLSIDSYTSAINNAQLGTADIDDLRSSIGALYLNRGLALTKVGRFNEARSDLQEVIRRRAAGDKGVTDEKFGQAKRVLGLVDERLNNRSRGDEWPCGAPLE